MRRVVVTGLGLLTPLGCGVAHNWNRLVAGESGIRAIDGFDVSDLPAKVAGTVPDAATGEGGFDPDEWVEPKEQRKIDRFILLGIAAAEQAVRDRSEEHTSELQSLLRISYAVFCLKKKNNKSQITTIDITHISTTVHQNK